MSSLLWGLTLVCMHQVPDEHSREDDSRKRKRGEVEHNPDLSETETATGMSLTLSLVCHGLCFCHVLETVPLFFSFFCRN